MSAFVKECWRLVGNDCDNPGAVNELFEELEMLRERQASFDSLHKSVVNDLNGAESRIVPLRTELSSFQNRESVHIRPLFSAMTAHLLFPDAPEAESLVSLRNRIDRARNCKVAWGTDGAESVGPLAELEKMRAENAAVKQQLDNAEKEIRYLNTESADLQRIQGGNKELLRAIRRWEATVKDPDPGVSGMDG